VPLVVLIGGTCVWWWEFDQKANKSSSSTSFPSTFRPTQPYDQRRGHGSSVESQLDMLEAEVSNLKLKVEDLESKVEHLGYKVSDNSKEIKELKQDLESDKLFDQLSGKVRRP
jgi:peptidoglycan hydrolase CwlO-like protein